jgi:hypothetical protein
MTFNRHDDADIPLVRRHVRTGRPPGAPKGNIHRLVHGLRSSEFVEGRRALMSLLRRAKQAMAQADR